MKQSYVIMLSAILLAAGSAFAGRVTSVDGDFVYVSMEKMAGIAKDEKVCLYRKIDSRIEKLGCAAAVAEIDSNKIKIKLTDSSIKVKVGDFAFSAKTDRALAEAKPADSKGDDDGDHRAETIEHIEKDREKPPRFGLLFGTQVGTVFYSYVLDFKYLVNSHVTIGLQPIYGSKTVAAITTTTTWVGGMLIVDYFSEAALRGFWIQAGAGTMVLTAKGGATETSISSSFLATIGWREKWTQHFNVGIAAGIQYIAAPQRPAVPIGFTPVQPVFSANIGFVF